jgi:hypothetical protein
MAEPIDNGAPSGYLAQVIVASVIYGTAYRLACLAEAIETGQISEAYQLGHDLHLDLTSWGYRFDLERYRP